MKSHFKFTKGQRNGIFLLVFLIIVFQCVYFFSDFNPNKNIENNVLVNEIVNEFLVSTGYLPGAHGETCAVYKKVLKTKPAWKEK